MKRFLIRVFLVTISVVVSFFLFEAVARLFNYAGRNYDIEMWKYAVELKRLSSNPTLGIEHIPNKTARLQNTVISINSMGFRDREYSQEKPAGVYRILVLGSSITLGWGVDYETAYAKVAERKLNDDLQGIRVEVINCGVGNYNAQREVEQFFTRGVRLNPDMVLVSFFMNDLAELEPSEPNFFVKHFQLVVMAWSKWNYLATKYGMRENFEQLYKRLYREDSKQWLKATSQLKRLIDYAKEHKIRVLLAVTPDIHDFDKYPFQFIHDMVRKVAQENQIEFIDFFDSLKTKRADELWNMPGDPHPNGSGHRLMADQFVSFLETTPPLASYAKQRGN
jgi:lysophospholipase L1-like esterase